MWFIILFASNASSSKYLKLDSQKNNFLTALHAFVVPLLTVVYFIINREPFGYDYLIDQPLLHLLSMSTGFYVFSIINLYRVEKQPPMDMIGHHFVCLAFFLYMIFTPEFQAYYCLILIPQCTAFIYHIHVIFKETEGEPKSRSDYWYNMNFYSWIFFRFLIQGIITVVAFYLEFTQFKLPFITRIVMILGIGFSYYFNVYWLIILLKKRKEKKLILQSHMRNSGSLSADKQV